MRPIGGVLDAGRESSQSEQFAALWEAFYRPVYAYARRRTTAEGAADVATATFLVLWRRIDHPPGAALPWLYSVARRELANERRGDVRRRRLLASLSQRLRAGTGTGTGDAGAGADVAEAVVAGASARDALAQLRPDDREILMLVAWEGLDSDAAALVLGISPATFAVRLHRARRRLEAALSDTQQEEQDS